MKFGVVVFPGTLCDQDCFDVIDRVLGQPVSYIWHQETDLRDFDAVVLPGGFSYGDYLRCGAVARFSPVMGALEKFASEGKLVYGICNGFQILCESGLLPGALIMNNSLQFRCKWVNLRVENNSVPFTSQTQKGQILRIPIAHGEGNYFADAQTLADMEANGQIILRYCDEIGQITAEANPNGSINNIAGIVNKAGNVFGMMPHPERCSEPLMGGTDGLFIWRSIVQGTSAVTKESK